MSDSLSDSITDAVLQFYDQLGEEADSKIKKSSSFLPHKYGKHLKVDVKSINLRKSLDKIAQKEINRKKILRKKWKKEKSKLSLNNKANDLSSIVKEPQKSNIDIPTDINESISVSSNKYVDILNDLQEPVDSISDQQQLYISCKPQEDGSLLVTLFPNSKLFLIGYYSLHLILGDISVLGYKFKKNEKRVVYSPVSHSILSINCLEGYQVKKLDTQQIKDLHIPLEYVQDLNISMDQPVVIVRLNRYCSNITQIFDESEITEKKNKLDVCLWKETIDVELVEDQKKPRVPLLNEPEEWTSYIEEIQPSVILDSKNILVITGGKGVGKSTFLKYIVNTYLGIFKVPDVACIDLDPGQAEFSLPGCLTLSVCSSPLLGPSFSHHENSLYSYQKQILLGDISVNQVMNEYLNIASHLYHVYKEKFPDIPLVVNTMGFTTVAGYDIMIDILRIFDPSHVINIESEQSNKNYPTKLTTKIVSTTNRGILRNEIKNLNYDIAVLKSISKESSLKIKSKLSREINIMGYLSLLWEKGERNLNSYTFKAPLIINWRKVAIHVHRSIVPPSHLLLAINGSLVALCNIGEHFLYKVDSSQPLRIHYNTSSLLSCECVGWGVVRGVDPITQEISIFTPLNEVELKKINLIAVPNVQLPVYFRSYFSIDCAPYVQRERNNNKN